MKTFFEFLCESMSYDEALNFFGLDSVPSKTELNRLFKKLALKYHPDHQGGSDEMMKQLNNAKEILSKTTGNSRTKKTQDDKEKEEFVVNYINSIFAKIDLDIYREYLKDIFNVEFTAKTYTHNGSTMVYDVELADKERNKVFVLKFVTPYIFEIQRSMFGGGLGSKDTTIDISLASYIYVDGKKQKLQREFFKKSNDSDMYTNPEILLPKAKLEKMINGGKKVATKAKRDFESMMLMKHEGETVDFSGGNSHYSYYRIPYDKDEKGNEICVTISRFSMKFPGTKKASVRYMIDGVGTKTKYMYSNNIIERKEIHDRYGIEYFTGLNENLEGFNILDDLLSSLQKSKNIEKFISDFKEKSAEE